MQQPVKPLFFIPMSAALQYRYMTFRLNSGNISSCLSAIQHKWNQLMPDAPFEYKFVDETLANLYTSETRMKKASMLATGIALIIVLLGVAGIVGQSITKRTKEVGIRKVLGASVSEIIMLFTREFAAIFLVANAIAWPTGFLVMNRWLNDYAYRINLNLVPFVVVASVIMILTTLLISLRVTKIAVANPVKSLRTE
jgi:putative ABC transport system permease protein